MIYENACNKVAEELGLPKGLVRKVYQSYWKAIREHVKALPLKDDLTDDEFMELQPNVNIPSIGKLYVTLDRYKRMKKRFKIVSELKNAAHNKD